MDSLGELSDFCKLILFKIADNQDQFHRLKLCSSEIFSEKERSVLSLFKKLRELKNERKMFIFEEEIAENNNILDKELSERIRKAKYELLIANATNITKDLIVENFIETNPILQAVYLNQKLTEQDRIINSSLENCDNIISKLLKLHNILLENEKKVMPLQKEVLKLFFENREKVRKILEITTSIKDREEKILSVSEKQQKEKFVKEMNDIKHRVTIGIILESGIDWYGNEHWKNVMFKAGELDNYVIS
ncbi:hypothetical protein PCANB_000744 [Pneumocystis canis]|nr:hypothetical protein PCANB_000744 [Pneumocystis canis]